MRLYLSRLKVLAFLCGLLISIPILPNMASAQCGAAPCVAVVPHYGAPPGGCPNNAADVVNNLPKNVIATIQRVVGNRTPENYTVSVPAKKQIFLGCTLDSKMENVRYAVIGYRYQ